MKFDKKDFYSSITESLLKDALNSANKTTHTTTQYRTIILNESN